ncbi:phage terminase small subunit [Streptomyces sp. f150]|uniref:phage terminase small subunit n=1 Tax=Streptomyces sp. f150 TaxID=1827699 RepID=UPI00211D93A6|nr:hypothetical protein [Streptomyces sp. f150]
MAGRGFAPKETRSRARDAKSRDAELQRIQDDGAARGDILPEGVLPDQESWHPRTVQWWETWRRSPQSQTFIATDWDFLLDTALLHHVMWTKGRWEFASEVRLRAAKYGATPEDRMRLKMKIETPGEPADRPAAPQRPASARRKSLRIVSDDVAGA